MLELTAPPQELPRLRGLPVPTYPARKKSGEGTPNAALTPSPRRPQRWIAGRRKGLICPPLTPLQAQKEASPVTQVLRRRIISPCLRSLPCSERGGEIRRRPALLRPGNCRGCTGGDDCAAGVPTARS